jgi:hypothetical protein
MSSCLIRTCHKTVRGYSEMFENLMNQSTNSHIFCDMDRKDPMGSSDRPRGWDSQAFCSNLHYASVSMPLDTINQGSNKKSLQARCYELLYARGDPWNKLLSRRLKLFCNYDSDEESIASSDSTDSTSSDTSTSSSSSSSADLEPTITYSANDVSLMLGDYGRVLKKLSSIVITCNIKTLVNGWSTSGRYQEKLKLGCIFGCNNGLKGHQDSLRHYLVCEPLWTIIASTCKFPPSAIFHSTTNRLGLTFPSVAKCELITVAYLTYHGLKMTCRKEILSAKRSGDFSPIHDIAFRLAKFHYAEHHSNVKRPAFAKRLR